MGLGEDALPVQGNKYKSSSGQPSKLSILEAVSKSNSLKDRFVFSKMHVPVTPPSSPPSDWGCKGQITLDPLQKPMWSKYSGMARDEDSDIDTLIDAWENEETSQCTLVIRWEFGGEVPAFATRHRYIGDSKDYGTSWYSASELARESAKYGNEISLGRFRKNGVLFSPSDGDWYPGSHLSFKTVFAATACCGMVIMPLAAAQHHVPEAVLHTAIGTSVTSSVVVPILRNIGDGVPLELLITTYSIWGAGFIAHLVCELFRRPNGLQRRLLLGAVLLLSLNLQGTLGLEGIFSWGPLALTSSLCAVSVIMEFISAQEFAGILAGLLE